MEKNHYIPQLAKIKRIVQETPDVKTFFVNNVNKKNSFTPGQFLQVSVFGIGEAPVSISSAPDEELLQFTLRCVGKVTNELCRLKEKEFVGLRGPFGNGFNIEELKGKNLLFIGGGLGIAPLRSLLRYCLSQRANFKNIYLLYGARNERDLVYKQELNSFKENSSLICHISVDQASPSWKGDVGVVTNLLDKIKVTSTNTAALICGPSAMMRFCVPKLLKLKMNKKSIFLSIERHMKCGIGKCGHCYIGEYFVCKDGPVFRFSDLEAIKPEQIF